MHSVLSLSPSAKVVTAGGDELRDLKSGSLTVMSKVRESHHQNINNHAKHTIPLSDVIQHKSLRHNLLSLPRLLTLPFVRNCEFDGERATVFNLEDRPILIAERVGDLYLVQLERCEIEASIAEVHAAESPRDFQMHLHESLGHLSHDRLAKLISTGAIKVPIGFKLSDSPLQCRSCMLGKMTQLSYAHRRPEKFDTQQPFAMFVADLHGPVRTESLGGKKYVLVIIDVGTDFSWTIPIAQKSDAEDEIMKLIRALHVEHGKVPTRFHSDRGGEFMSDRLKQFWEERGVTATQTLPYSPQHNGIAERFNRSIVEQARTMMIRAGAPKLLWAEAIIAANYIRNRTKIGNDLLVPAQRLKGSKVALTYEHFHPWGCNAMVKRTPQLVTDKYDAVAVETAFVGFENPLGFRFINHDSFPKVTVSRHARFIDSSFTVMHTLRDELQQTEFADDEADPEFFGSLTLRNEIKLMKMISQQRHSDEESKEEEEAHPSSLPADSSQQQASSSESEPRRSSRASVPVSRYGLISPGDIGQGLLSIVELEDEFTSLLFGNDSLAAVAARSPETPAQARIRERARQQARDAARLNPLIDPNRRNCNAKGELITPSQRCTADTRKGTQCGARTRNGEYCWNHLQSLMGLRIKKSNIAGAGRGVFAGRNFSEGDHVTDYTGDTVLGGDQRIGGSNYVFGLSNRRAIDAARTNTAPGRLINDARGTDSRPNLTWKVDNIRHRVRLVASRPIAAGEELYVPYGRRYWSMHKTREREQTKQREQIAKLARQARAHIVELAPESVAPLVADPLNFKQAMSSPQREQWKAAILAEQQSLRKLEVYSIIDELPKGARLLDTKFVFKMKLDATGKADRAKARLVARGFMQREGIDYYETFASVFSYKTFRVLLALAAHHDLEINMWDVETAYLYAHLKEDIYIAVPEGLEGPEKGKVLKLNKALYGLKQAGREWNLHLVKALIALGYESCKHSDASLFRRKSKTGRFIFIATFVDDMPHIFHRADKDEVEQDKQQLLARFKIKDLGPASLILGMRITRDRAARTIKLDQEQYITRILDQFGFAQCRTDITPESKGKLSTKDSIVSNSQTVQLHPQVTAKNYAAAVGSLMYAANSARPDIAHAVNMAARLTSTPNAEAILLVKRIFRYLAGTKQQGLTFSRSPSANLVLTAYSDADWAGSESDARSTTGVVLKLANVAVCWISQKQGTVSLSSSEAEYVAASESVRDILWLRTLLDDLNQAQQQPTTLFIDNATAICMATDESNSGGRRKHINVKYHFLRDQISSQTIRIEWVQTADQQADIMTKALDRNTFSRLRDLITGTTVQSESSSSSQ